MKFNTKSSFLEKAILNEINWGDNKTFKKLLKVKLVISIEKKYAKLVVLDEMDNVVATYGPELVLLRDNDTITLSIDDIYTMFEIN